MHISVISWTSRISDLHKRYKVGQEIEILMVSLDKDNRRMSLSVKQLDKNPWESIAEQFKVGQIIKGPVTNITDFGVFVQLVPGIDGLVHISDLSWTEHVEHPGDRYNRGDDIEAVILGIDPENKKVSLGIKQLSDDPWENIEQEYPVGLITEGKVSKVTNFGAFVRLSNGVEGLVHISELSDKNVDKVTDILEVDQTSKFRVISVNKDERKLGLSLKLEGSGSSTTAVQRKTKNTMSPGHKRAIEGPKPKSLLQIELEKMAARSKKDDTSDSDTESK